LIHSFYQRNDADDRTSDLAMSDLRKVVNRIVPLAKLRQEEIATMRMWANQHAIGASARPREEQAGSLVIGGRSLDL